MLLWLAPLALAQDDPDPAEEIVVWGKAVEQARAAVVEQIVDLGYAHAKDKDGRTVFRSDDAWKGKVVLYDDAFLEVRRRGPTLREVPPIAGTHVRPYPLCLVVPTYCIAAGSWYVSDRRWGGIEDDVSDATSAPLATLGDRIADRSIAKTLDGVPLALEGLWHDGQPLVSEHRLDRFEERRVELLRYWDTRTENAWGQQVRELVAAFVRAVVEPSDHPYTEAEKAAFESGRTSATPFPWTGDPADVTSR